MLDITTQLQRLHLGPVHVSHPSEKKLPPETGGKISPFPFHLSTLPMKRMEFGSERESESGLFPFRRLGEATSHVAMRRSAWLTCLALLTTVLRADEREVDSGLLPEPWMLGEFDDPETLKGLRAVYDATNGSQWKNPIASIECFPGIDIAAEIGKLGGSFSFNLLLDNARPGQEACEVHQECLTSREFDMQCYFSYYSRPFFTPNVTLCFWEGTSCCLDYTISAETSVAKSPEFRTNRTIFQIQPGYRVFAPLFQPSIQSLDSQGYEVVIAYECEQRLSLRALGLANFSLEGFVPPDIKLLGGLEWLDMSNNMGLSGEIPMEMRDIKFMISADFRNTSMHCGNHCPLPDFLSFDDQQMPTKYVGMTCSGISTQKGFTNSMQVGFEGTGIYALDPDYFNFATCECEPGYREVRSKDSDGRQVLRCDLGGPSSGPIWYAIMIPIAVFVLLAGLLLWRYHATIYKEIRASRVARIKRNSTPGLLTGKNLQHVLQWQGADPEKPLEVSLVVTDVKGSSSLWEWQALAMDLATEIHDKLMRRLIPKFCGYEVTTEGDSFTIAFHDPLDAIQYCLAAQVELLQQTWPEEFEHNEETASLVSKSGQLLFKGLRVRMAIATGTVDRIKIHSVTKRAEYFGGAAHEVVELSHYPDGGQILMSRATYAHIIPRISGLLAPGKGERVVKKKHFGKSFMGVLRSSTTLLRSKRHSWSRRSKPKAPPAFLEQEDCIPVVIDMGAHVVGNIVMADENHLGNGTELVQVLPGRLIERACLFPALATTYKLSPGFFDAPMALDGFGRMLSRCTTSKDVHVEMADGTVERQTRVSMDTINQQNPIGAVTVVFCRVERYSEIAAYNLEVAEASMELYLEIARRALTTCDGYECQEQDGALMMTFSDPVKAVEWCLLVQDSLMQADWDPRLLEIKAACKVNFQDPWKDSDNVSASTNTIEIADANAPQVLWCGLRACMGIFQGTPVAVCPHRSTGRADYFGTFVNRAARLMGASMGGEVLLPMELAERVMDEMESKEAESCISEARQGTQVELHDVGGYKFKGVPGEMQVGLLLPKTLGGRAIARHGRHKTSMVKFAKLSAGSLATRVVYASLPKLPDNKKGLQLRLSMIRSLSSRPENGEHLPSNPI